MYSAYVYGNSYAGSCLVCLIISPAKVTVVRGERLE